jgi:hypothetical protein
MTSENLDNYTPVVPNFYNYKAKKYMTAVPERNLFNYEAIYICAYTVNNDARYPFQKFILTKETSNGELGFPGVPFFNSMNPENIVTFIKVLLFGLLELKEYKVFEGMASFDGFYECNDNLYAFFDLTKCVFQLQDIYSESPAWLVLVDEIINKARFCDVKINDNVTNLFRWDKDLCFLTDENDKNYEIPIVCYVGKPQNKLNFTLIFGESAQDNTALFGPYYYFTNFHNAAEKNTVVDKQDSKTGIVRFAIFQGTTKYIENHPNDPIDNSETKIMRLNDETLDQNIERITVRISDHDGNWTKDYDSVYLGNVELDNGTCLTNVPMFVTKEYDQQVPLSYHYVKKTTIGEKYITYNKYEMV